MEGRESGGVIQQSLSSLAEVGPCLRKVGPNRHGMVQFRRCFFHFVPVRVELRPQIARISRVRCISEDSDGTIQVFRGGLRFTRLEQS